MERRNAVFAGSWYPDSAAACEREIEAFLRKGLEPQKTPGGWLGGIVPHAGWFYSGQIACNVIQWLKDDQSPEVVVLFGMHLHPGSSNYIMPQGAWQTPFGDLPVAEALAEHLMQRHSFIEETPQRFTRDNTIELQLPFVKYLLDPDAILALGVPPAQRALDIGRTVADWARQQGCTLKVIGSTDLTHYGANYGFKPHGSGERAVQWVKQTNDQQVIDAMLELAPDKVIRQGVENQNACCSGAAAAALASAVQMGANRARQVAYTTSYDKSPGDSFVGYVGVVFGR
jgi:AmmeMemoRadiSam system protein B